MGSVGHIEESRRVERRRTARVGVDLWVEEHSGPGIYYHRVTNLSWEGFFVEKKLPFRVGEIVAIEMDLPHDGRRLKARSRVVANHRDDQANLVGAGFQFVELDARMRRGIAALMEQAREQSSAAHPEGLR